MNTPVMFWRAYGIQTMLRRGRWINVHGLAWDSAMICWYTTVDYVPTNAPRGPRR